MTTLSVPDAASASCAKPATAPAIIPAVGPLVRAMIHDRHEDQIDELAAWRQKPCKRGLQRKRDDDDQRDADSPHGRSSPCAPCAGGVFTTSTSSSPLKSTDGTDDDGLVDAVAVIDLLDFSDDEPLRINAVDA